MNERFLPTARGGDLPARLSGQELAVPEPYDLTEERTGFRVDAFLRIIYRWRWLFLAITAFVALATITYTALQTPLYRATATLELNPAPARVVDDEKGADEPRQADRDFLALQIGLIKSRAVAERVARKLNLGRSEAFLGEPPAPNATATDAVGTLMANFSATGSASDRIMQVSYVHPDPQMATRIINGFAEQAIENTFERADEATMRSRNYLRKRLEVLRTDLERSEKELIAYARSANIVNVEVGDAPKSADSAGGTLLAGNLIALNAQLADAQNARIVAQQRYAQAGASVNSAADSDSTIQALRQQRAQLQAEYDQKLSRFKPEYPEMIDIRSRVEGLDRQIAQASSRTGSTVSGALRAEYIAAQNRESQLRARIAQLESKLLDLNDRGVRYTILKRAVDANRSLYNALLERLGQENSSATRTSSVSLVDAASVPQSPFSPDMPRAILLGLLAGLVLGAAGAIGADKWYDTINLPQDLRDLLPFPLLGIIPKTQAAELDELLANPRSSIAEAYHSTRAALQYASASGAPKSVLFTSTRAAEGKTSSSIAIAADFIGVGRRVVVIDADLRKPSLRASGDVPGLSELLTGACTLDQALAETETRGLYLIHAGAIPPSPTVLLDNRRLPELLRELERHFDIVVIDGPPVLGLADAPLLSRATEATVVIVESGKTRRRGLEDSVRRLLQAGGNVVGTVMTKFDHKAQGGYGYGGYEYDYYSYGGDSPKRALVAPSPDHVSAA